MHCSSLATVTFEKVLKLKLSLVILMMALFLDCSSLTSIEIPASVETIGKEAFKRCSSLATVTFEKGSQLKIIGEVILLLLILALTRIIMALSRLFFLDLIEIPASVETIEATAFKRCSKLTTVTFEKGSQLKTIGEVTLLLIIMALSTQLFFLDLIEIPASVKRLKRQHSAVFPIGNRNL